MHVPWAVRFPGSARSLDLFGQHTGGAIAGTARRRSSALGHRVPTGQVFDHPVPGAIRIADWVREHGTSLPIHPTQLYESLAQLLLFVLLMIARKYRRFHADRSLRCISSATR